MSSSLHTLLIFRYDAHALYAFAVKAIARFYFNLINAGAQSYGKGKISLKVNRSFLIIHKNF